MKAVAVNKVGEAPALMNLPKPTAGDHEILVRLGAAGVNPFDWKIADGALVGHMPHVFPLILGVDGAGTVEAVGSGVTRFQVGDGVFGSFLHAPVGTGTYAEYVAAPETLAIIPRPRGMYSEQAAAVPTAGMTALDAIDRAGLEEGRTLLIIGASGGVGSFAVQLAARRRIRTLAASRLQNREYLNKLGATRVYDGSTPSFVQDVRAGNPEGVDALLDLLHSAKDLEPYLAAVRSGGKVVSTVGGAAEELLRPRGLDGVNINMQPTAAALERLSEEFSAGRLRIPLEQKIPLEAAPDALSKSRGGQARGKTVIKI
jgi:NADPH:quinone reductase-like Zn-dependent oxidoreductase